jgi:hypothetical protein
MRRPDVTAGEDGLQIWRIYLFLLLPLGAHGIRKTLVSLQFLDLR